LRIFNERYFSVGHPWKHVFRQILKSALFISPNSVVYCFNILVWPDYQKLAHLHRPAVLRNVIKDIAVALAGRHSKADWDTHNVTVSEKLVSKTDGERTRS
jgi:hypothetical protein